VTSSFGRRAGTRPVLFYGANVGEFNHGCCPSRCTEVFNFVQAIGIRAGNLSWKDFCLSVDWRGEGPRQVSAGKTGHWSVRGAKWFRFQGPDCDSSEAGGRSVQALRIFPIFGRSFSAWGGGKGFPPAKCEAGGGATQKLRKMRRMLSGERSSRPVIFRVGRCRKMFECEVFWSGGGRRTALGTEVGGKKLRLPGVGRWRCGLQEDTFWTGQRIWAGKDRPEAVGAEGKSGNKLGFLVSRSCIFEPPCTSLKGKGFDGEGSVRGENRTGAASIDVSAAKRQDGKTSAGEVLGRDFRPSGEIPRRVLGRGGRDYFLAAIRTGPEREVRGWPARGAAAPTGSRQHRKKKKYRVCNKTAGGFPRHVLGNLPDSECFIQLRCFSWLGPPGVIFHRGRRVFSSGGAIEKRGGRRPRWILIRRSFVSGAAGPRSEA